jgi:hypothetical protein
LVSAQTTLFKAQYFALLLSKSRSKLSRPPQRHFSLFQRTIINTSCLD